MNSSLRSGNLFAFAFAFGAISTVVACSSDDGKKPGTPDDTGGAGTGSGGSAFGGQGGLGGQNPNGDGGTSSGGGSGGSITATSCDQVSCLRGTCDDSSGLAVCSCNSGFAGSDCENVNECSGGGLCENGQCRDTYGGFYCDCPSGYVASGSSCVDVNECQTNPCDSNATCTNVPGGFTCTCNSGFVGNGSFCKQVDACAGNPCGANGSCVNVPGSSPGYVCQCDLGHSGATDCNHSCATVSFVDSALEAGVRAAIGKPSGAISSSDLAGHVTLDLSNYGGVLTLEGLECWPTLETLIFNNSAIGTNTGSNPNRLAALAQLNRLKNLELTCTLVDSLDQLTNHPTLETLTVENIELTCPSAITDISAVPTLSNLRSLSLVSHDLSGGLGSLAGLRFLTDLTVSGCSLTAVPSLTGLTALSSLDLSFNALSSLAGIAGATGLRELTLYSNQLSSISEVSGLHSLEMLDYGYNSLGSQPDLSALTKLRSINARASGLSSVGALASVSSLREVDVSSNSVTTLQPFVASGFVGTLTMGGNPISCDTEADVLAALKKQGVDLIGSCQ